MRKEEAEALANERRTVLYNRFFELYEQLDEDGKEAVKEILGPSSMATISPE